LFWYRHTKHVFRTKGADIPTAPGSDAADKIGGERSAYGGSAALPTVARRTIIDDRTDPLRQPFLLRFFLIKLAIMRYLRHLFSVWGFNGGGQYSPLASLLLSIAGGLASGYIDGGYWQVLMNLPCIFGTSCFLIPY